MFNDEIHLGPILRIISKYKTASSDQERFAKFFALTFYDLNQHFSTPES